MTKQFKLTVKSQVTVPKDVRDTLGLRPGDSVSFERDGKNVMLRKGGVAALDDVATLAEFRGRLRRAREKWSPAPLGMSTDEYMALIREPVPPPSDS